MVYKDKEAETLLRIILQNIDPDGKYPFHKGDAGYYKHKKVWVAFDNETGDCWVEEFKTEKEAVDWINNYNN